MRRTRQWLGWLVLFVVIRTALNAANRMAYPFRDIFRAGLGLSQAAIAQALAWRSASLVVGPALAWWPERHGRRAGMLFGLALFVVGMVLGALWRGWWGFTLALVLAAWAKVAFDTSMQAFVGDRVAYRGRGAWLAATEFSWSLSFFVGMPVVGWLLARGDWRLPFWAFAVLGVVFAEWVWRWVPVQDRARGDGGMLEGSGVSGLGGLQWLYALRAAPLWQAAAFGFFATAANEVVGLLFGAWLRQAYGFALGGLSLAATLIGLAELSGEGLTLLAVDGVGKRRFVTLGLLGNMLAALALPWLAAQGQGGALLGLVAFFFTFETLLVGSIPLMTQILPHRRALAMGTFAGSVALGRALGATLAPSLYAWGSMTGLTWAAIGLDVLALAALARLRPARETKRGAALAAEDSATSG